MDRKKRQYDDLTTLKGIGPARQKWLQATFGVQTFLDLATLTVAEIEVKMKEEGRIAARSEIASWIEQATAKADEAGQTEQTADSSEFSATEETNHQPIYKSKMATNGWRPFASFVVEFQERSLEGAQSELRTTIHHVEEDADAAWPGLENQQHCEWMLKQIQTVKDGVFASQEDRARLDDSTTPERSPGKLQAELKIRSIQIKQSNAKERLINFPGTEASARMLAANRPFAASVDFALLGHDAAEITTRQIKYTARAFIYNNQTNESQPYGTAVIGTLDADRFAYEIKLPEITLERGSYRLYAVISAQPSPLKPHFLEIPDIRVTEQGA